MGLGLVKVRFKVRFKVSIGGRVRVSFFGSFRVRVRGGVRGRFWLGPGTRLDPYNHTTRTKPCRVIIKES